jgi:hypothetical protein
MGFFVTTAWGGSEHRPSTERMRAILVELDTIDEEHAEAWLSHENGWSISAMPRGHVVLENVEGPDEPPRHLRGVSRERVIQLWEQLAAGNADEVMRAGWQPGYGDSPATEGEAAERAMAALATDRALYDALGSERAEQPYAEPSCARGAVRASVFCRSHHFANVMRRPCPFSD